jgi:hypothetical protein
LGKSQIVALVDVHGRHDGQTLAIAGVCVNRIGTIETIVSTYSDYSIIHQCKEIENFLLIPSAIDRAVVERLEERKTRGSSAETHKLQTVELLEQFASEKHNYVLSQFIAGKRKFQREQNAALDESTVTEDVLKEFELLWSDQTQRLSIIPGKEALSWLNRIFQEKYGITISSTNIIHKLQPAEIPEGIRKLIQSLRQFSAQRIAA